MGECTYQESCGPGEESAPWDERILQKAKVNRIRVYNLQTPCALGIGGYRS